MTSSRGVLAATAVAAVAAIAPSIAFAAEDLRFTSPPALYDSGEPGFHCFWSPRSVSRAQRLDIPRIGHTFETQTLK